MKESGDDFWALSGWLDHSVFFAENLFDDEYAHHWNGATSHGDATGTAPVTGSATWDGVMIGVHTGHSYGVIGNAQLTADFAGSTLDVAFTDIHRPDLLPTDGDLPVPLEDMRFDDVPVYFGGYFEVRRRTGREMARRKLVRPRPCRSGWHL